MSLKTIGSSWNAGTVSDLNGNFKHLSGIEVRAIQSMFESASGDLTPIQVGLPKNNSLDMRALNDFGINFTANTNAVIHTADVYSATTTKFTVGLAEQNASGVATSELHLKEVQVNAGWNKVEINFPIEAGRNYTLFKRYAGNSVVTNTQTVSGWVNHNFMGQGEDITFRAGKFLNDTRTYSSYSTFFNIALITNLAQVYHIMSTSVAKGMDVYVGDNPPADSNFWFKPIGG